MIKHKIKAMIRLVGRRIEKHPRLKKCVLKIFDHFPYLKHRLIRIIKIERVYKDITPTCYEDLSPYGRAIYRQLTGRED